MQTIDVAVRLSSTDATMLDILIAGRMDDGHLCDTNKLFVQSTQPITSFFSRINIPSIYEGTIFASEWNPKTNEYYALHSARN